MDYKEVFNDLYDQFIEENGREPSLNEIRDFELNYLDSIFACFKGE